MAWCKVKHVCRGCKSTLCRARQPWPQPDKACMPVEHQFSCITSTADTFDMLCSGLASMLKKYQCCLQ